MAIVRSSPWPNVFDVQRDMDVLMRRVTDRLGWPTGRGAWVPAVDMFRRDGDLVVRAELPGIDPQRDVEVTVQDNVLTIRGERRREERTDGNGSSRFESAYGRFERSVLLPEGVKDDDINARYDDGILEVVVPGGAERAGARRIPIESGRKAKALTTKGRKA